MKFETLFLRGLFGACVLVCGLTLLAMVTAKPASYVVTTGHTIAATSSATAVHARMAG
ncbi:hypothetical protein ACFONN_14360 [Dyella humi]|uniref:Uncharacterized protein n=1 Tax=Dyella humi TaxID=1770547 RepID=A0ABW8ILT7_9GAMM